ncbi:hypothetical protein PG993_003743 [Apiospora rasikravindrae]|uniref:Uncharacterized protein n=1 Tax=Apiospora rasikravindrae TaxID=990691 RepID=A0ABR1U0L4_9PEZI
MPDSYPVRNWSICDKCWIHRRPCFATTTPQPALLQADLWDVLVYLPVERTNGTEVAQWYKNTVPGYARDAAIELFEQAKVYDSVAEATVQTGGSYQGQAANPPDLEPSTEGMMPEATYEIRSSPQQQQYQISDDAQAGPSGWGHAETSQESGHHPSDRSDNDEGDSGGEENPEGGEEAGGGGWRRGGGRRTRPGGC